VNAYAVAGWENFFVAQVGASAALIGLLFVAVSINLAKVLAYPQLPGRAAETLTILVGVLFSSTLGLIPGQPAGRLGIELAAAGLLLWSVPVVIQLRAPRSPEVRRSWMARRVIFTQLATLPLMVAGGSLAAQTGGGLYWMAPTVVLSYGVAVFNAWVLLIEIQR
jgi:hypothetical protein